MVKVCIKNDQSVFAISPAIRRAVRKAAALTLEYLDFKSRDCEISLTFTDNEKIRELNLEYRKKDAPTDVLSFPLIDWDGGEDDGDIEIDGMPVFLGDIVISLEKAYAQAKEYGSNLLREVSFLTVHSTLHLMGYDHEKSEEDEKEMFAIQSIIMNIIDGEKIGI